MSESRILKLSALLATLALAACGTAPMKPSAPVSTAPSRAPLPAVRIPVVPEPGAAPALPPANSGRGGYYQDDGPGENPPPNLADVPDADVRNDPLIPRSSVMHDYQRERVLTLIDPYHDPLGKGFHIIQSMIAIGSGGVSGKGWTHGTQAHLEFIPERTTDFIFAVFSEEFGLAGNLVLLVLYLLLIWRGLAIAQNAPTFFTRLLAGAITMVYFTYAFVNMGMVSGIVPVVGVPLPFMSYGGAALATLGLGAGILMSIQHASRLSRGGAASLGRMPAWSRTA